MSSTKYNPEKRVWRGKSYRKGGKSIAEIKRILPNVDLDNDCSCHVDDNVSYGRLREFENLNAKKREFKIKDL